MQEREQLEMDFEEEQQDLEVRVLHPSEVALLTRVPPFDQFAELSPEMLTRGITVVGAIRGGKVVAYWMLHDAVHVEPLWVGEEDRRNPAVLRPLLERVLQVVEKVGAPMVYAVIDPEAQGVEAMARRVGFLPMLGRLFYRVTGQGR